VTRSLGGAAAVALCAALAVAPADAADWQPGMASAKRYARTRVGNVAIAVRSQEHLWAWHGRRTMRSASVLKAMLLVAYLDHPRVRHRNLRAADHALIDPMIRRSDNTAASRVLAYVGAKRVRAVARRAGMRRFKLDPVIWGLSQIDAVDQTRFFLHIDERVVPRHRRTALHLLESIVPSQRWGIGRIRLPGWHVYLKGGWGSGTGAVEHQVVLLCRGEQRLSLAVLTTGSPSHEYAKQTLRGLFARLLRHLH
jgi:Beta-lactamase enzyme family